MLKPAENKSGHTHSWPRFLGTDLQNMVQGNGMPSLFLRPDRCKARCSGAPWRRVLYRAFPVKGTWVSGSLWRPVDSIDGSLTCQEKNVKLHAVSGSKQSFMNKAGSSYRYRKQTRIKGFKTAHPKILKPVCIINYTCSTLKCFR